MRESLASPVAKPRKRPVRTSPRMEPYKKTVDDWLRADLEAPRKQRHTAKRIGTRLEEEFGVTLPYTTVRDFVTARRRVIAAEEGAPVEGYLTRHNVPGADAEVDFGEIWVDLAGERVKCFLFAFRLAFPAGQRPDPVADSERADRIAYRAFSPDAARVSIRRETVGPEATGSHRSVATSARQSSPSATARATSRRILPGPWTARGFRHGARAADIAPRFRPSGVAVRAIGVTGPVRPLADRQQVSHPVSACCPLMRTWSYGRSEA